MPQFSVIIPIFNAAETLVEALQSVVHQSNKDFEIVATNDGSTDESVKIFEEITAEFENALLINQANAGLGNARNVAAQKASGNWLLFLDADDYWSANKLEILAQRMAENPEAEFMYHPVFELHSDGRMRERKAHAAHSVDEFIQLGNPFVPSAVAIKRSTFLQAGGFVEDKNQVEDLVFWLRLFKRKTNFLVLNQALTVYRMGHGLTADLDDHLKKVARAIDQAEVEGLVSAAQKDAFLNRKNYEAARQLHKQKSFKKALEFYALYAGGGLKKSMLVFLCRAGIAV